MLHGFLVHPNPNASGQTASPTLVPAGLVYHAFLATFAGVIPSPSDGPFKEACTSVAGKDPVVLPRGKITAHLAGNVVENATGAVADKVTLITELLLLLLGLEQGKIHYYTLAECI